MIQASRKPTLPTVSYEDSEAARRLVEAERKLGEVLEWARSAEWCSTGTDKLWHILRGE